MQVTKEQELKLDRNRKKFDIREEYFVRLLRSVLTADLRHPQRLNAAADEEWEPVRIPRPNGLPEWGVPPPEPPSSVDGVNKQS